MTNFSPYLGPATPMHDDRYYEIDPPAAVEEAHKVFIGMRAKELVEDDATKCLAVASYYFPTRMALAADKARQCGNVDAMLSFDELLHRGAELIAEEEWSKQEYEQ